MAEKQVEKHHAVLQPQRMGLVEDGIRQDWVATVEEKTTIEQVMNPAYWAHVSARMSPFDHIEARCEDGSWIADLVVMGCDRNWARVFLKAHYKLTTADVSMTQAAQHEVKFKGPHLKFCVIRLSDQVPVKEKCATQEEAALWLKEHERASVTPTI